MRSIVLCVFLLLFIRTKALSPLVFCARPDRMVLPRPDKLQDRDHRGVGICRSVRFFLLPFSSAPFRRRRLERLEMDTCRIVFLPDNSGDGLFLLSSHVPVPRRAAD